MIVIVVFDNVGGFGCRYFGAPESCEADIMRLERNIAISNHEAELSLGCTGLYVVSRHAAERYWTWIGSYKPVPRRIKAREGDFCGVGLWLCGVEIPGATLHMFLDTLTDKLERLMSDSFGWKTDTVDVGAIGIDDTLPASLARKSRRLPPGTGLDFERLEATAAFAYRDGSGHPLVVRALDQSQSGAGLHRLSRVLIPKDDETALHIRLPGARLGTEAGADQVYDLLTSTPPPRDRREEPAALPPPTAQDAFDRARPLQDAKPAFQAGPDPLRAIEKVRQDLESRVVDLEADQNRAWFWIRSGLALGVACMLGVAILVWLVVSGRSGDAPEAHRPVAAREAPRDPDPVSSAQPVPAFDTSRPGIPELRSTPAGDAADPYSRLDASTATIAGLLADGATLGSDETRRRLQKAFQGFVDVLQQSQEPRIRAIGDRLRPPASDIARPARGR
ncbi:hypothetical protein [uncultured Methylobacterium sp.]|uniref:hypothetical protein n=1 Tax=uncultured Methylobacterium sp. TaxID=157278 RepID=UPI00258BF075|nr:hypothetical protein [uncultured Methylobacterium sp.]